jgi:hypothetical protein
MCVRIECVCEQGDEENYYCEVDEEEACGYEGVFGFERRRSFEKTFFFFFLVPRL